MSETLVAVKLRDEAGYAEYRARMTPLLEAHGGRFVLDVRVAEVLRAPDDADFDRLFSIRFPDEDAREAFFSNPEYVAIRKQHFEPSVSATTLLGHVSAPATPR